ncbi:LysR substrate-binding domain-containing protein, partial [Burkholderia anthina]
LPTRGSLYAWELRKGKHDLLVRVDGQLIFNSTPQMLAAALEGYGLVYLPEDQLMPQVRAGRLKCVLKEWGATFPGYHAYYPSRRQSSRALSLVIDALRHRD